MKSAVFSVVFSILFSPFVYAETFPLSHLIAKGTEIKTAVEGLTSESCATDLRRVYEKIFYTRPSQYAKSELMAAASSLINQSFEMRQKIRSKIQEFNSQGSYTQECGDAAKRSLRALRAFEDYLGHLNVLNQQPLNLNAALSSNFELKSGDLLLSRGDAFTSATIARLGDEHLQFSHVALVYVDEETKKVFTIEAHMEKGSVVTPIEEYFSDGKVRSALYRQKDAKLAHAAAKLMYERVKTAMETTGNIKYDIQMDQEDSESLFCSEVVRVAYSEASHGQFMVPMFMSKFSMQNRDLFEKLNTEVTEAFLPADVESDPRFDLVMEWRDFDRINTAWTYDAIMTKLFDWMENEDYRLKSTMKIDVIKNLAYAARRTPFLKEKLKDRMSLDMTRDMIAATAIFYLVVNNFEKKLKILDENSIARKGYPLTIAEQFEAIETIKALHPKFSRAFSQ